VYSLSFLSCDVGVVCLHYSSQSATTASSSTSTSSQAAKPSASAPKSIFAKFSCGRVSGAAHSSQCLPDVPEDNVYILEPIGTDSPAVFWCSASDKYPTLARLARKYLSAPATSASVERLFSVAGSIIRARRSSRIFAAAHRDAEIRNYCTGQWTWT